MALPVKVMDQVLRGVANRLVGATRPWDKVRGPAGALILTLRRIGWELTSASMIKDDQGISIDMLRTAPHELRVLAARAVV